MSPREKDLLDALTHQVLGQVELNGDPEEGGITYLQAQAVALLLMPRINREEYMLLREFANLAKRGMGPCMREDVAEILTKLLDDVPVAKQ